MYNYIQYRDFLMTRIKFCQQYFECFDNEVQSFEETIIYESVAKELEYWRCRLLEFACM